LGRRAFSALLVDRARISLGHSALGLLRAVDSHHAERTGRRLLPPDDENDDL
jgi:hypothetical protein